MRVQNHPRAPNPLLPAPREGRQPLRMAAGSEGEDVAMCLHMWATKEMHFYPQGAFQGASMPKSEDLRRYVSTWGQEEVDGDSGACWVKPAACWLM